MKIKNIFFFLAITLFYHTPLIHSAEKFSYKIEEIVNKKASLKDFFTPYVNDQDVNDQEKKFIFLKKVTNGIRLYIMRNHKKNNFETNRDREKDREFNKKL